MQDNTYANIEFIIRALNSFPFHIIIIDTEGAIMYVNDSFL